MDYEEISSLNGRNSIAAWLFFIINLFKLPFHIFVWETVDVDSFIFNLKLLPALMIGLGSGVYLVRWINEAFFRKMILVFTAVGALMIFFG